MHMWFTSPPNHLTIMVEFRIFCIHHILLDGMCWKRITQCCTCTCTHKDHIWMIVSCHGTITIRISFHSGMELILLIFLTRLSYLKMDWELIWLIMTTLKWFLGTIGSWIGCWACLEEEFYFYICFFGFLVIILILSNRKYKPLRHSLSRKVMSLLKNPMFTIWKKLPYHVGSTSRICSLTALPLIIRKLPILKACLISQTW